MSVPPWLRQDGRRWELSQQRAGPVEEGGVGGSRRVGGLSGEGREGSLTGGGQQSPSFVRVRWCERERNDKKGKKSDKNIW